ncbi:MAG: hypothetical protein B7733_07335 [Myxococcales bacterium FL481]|nr:MAG: hypothetical protein B7733_07335 [Myxococcales bacterium FL481]
MTQFGISVVESLQGGLEIGAALVTPFLRSRRLRWGATPQEVELRHPGDDLVPNPKWVANHAISIRATQEQVWPWIAQIGQGRGGFYSYQELENLAGCGIQNTNRILHEHQSIRVGDPVRIHADTPPLTAAIVDRPTALVLYGAPAEGDEAVRLATSWAFLLREQPNGTTRLISRTRYDHRDGLRSRLMGGPWLLEPVAFVMERKMLRVIKCLVERDAQ